MALVRTINWWLAAVSILLLHLALKKLSLSPPEQRFIPGMGLLLWMQSFHHGPIPHPGRICSPRLSVAWRQVRCHVIKTFINLCGSSKDTEEQQKSKNGWLRKTKEANGDRMKVLFLLYSVLCSPLYEKHYQNEITILIFFIVHFSYKCSLIGCFLRSCLSVTVLQV